MALLGSAEVYVLQLLGYNLLPAQLFPGALR